MAQGQEQFQIVGFGGGDTPEAGRKFVSEHGLSFQNLYEESRDTWAELGVASQPAWVLYDSAGIILGRGAGSISASTVAELLP